MFQVIFGTLFKSVCHIVINNIFTSHLAKIAPFDKRSNTWQKNTRFLGKCSAQPPLNDKNYSHRI